MGRTAVWGVFCFVLACSAAGAGSALADEPSKADVAQARELFRKGVSLEVAQDYAGALAAFKEVALVRSTPQVRFHIALCEEKLGDLVQAVGSYKLAQIEADAAGAKDVSAASAEAVAALTPRIPKLTLRRGAGAAGAKVLVDGREVAGDLASALPVNPGAHAIRATAEGRKPFDVEVKLEAGESKEIELVLDAEDALIPVATARGTIAPIATAAPAVTGAPGSPLKTAGFVIGGLGVGSLAAAGVLYGLRQSAMNELDAQCGPDRQSCPESLRATRDNGVLYSTLSTATLVAGAGAVALGGALILVGSKGKPSSSVAVTPGGVIVSGRF